MPKLDNGGKTSRSGGSSGKWPIPAFPKPQTYPNKAGGSGSGVPGANKHASVGSLNVGKAAETKAKQ